MDYSVLVVDDSRLARMVVAGIVARTQPSWRLVEAESADRALEAIEAQPIDIVLIDFNMPGSDGLALAARIRETHPGMPIAIVSANAQDAIVARAKALDASFIEKPLSDESLARFLSGAALRLRRGQA